MEQECVASEVDASLYPAAVLIDELRSDDVHRRLNAVKSLSTIAVALGPQRTCEELLPFLQEECTDDDDEVLYTLAEQLEGGRDWVGGATNVHALLYPLEQLCSAEEISVRDRATEAIRELARQMPPADSVQHICVLITRLASHEWFTSRMSACSIFAAALSKVTEAKQKDDLLRNYFRLCSDETAMTRRQAANVLGGIAEVMAGDPVMSEIFQAFEKLSKDEQDSVRILAISNCIILGKLNRSPVWQQQVMAVVKACGEDKSWRVRYMVAEHAKALCEVFEVHAKASIVPLFLRLLSDQEMEVRTIASARIASIAKLNPSKEFLESLMPQMEKLTLPRELSPHVRVSLAGSVLSLTSIFGYQLTADYLMGVCLTLIKDESSDVRLKLIRTLGEISSVVGADVVLQSLLPAIIELAKDRQWRVRLAVLDSMPELAKSLGEAKFTQELHNLFPTWLVDSVYAVRSSAAGNYKRLCEVFGATWSEAMVVPQLQTMLSHKKYLYRISAIPCVGILAEVVSSSFLEKDLVPMLVKISSDPVPNVRLNVAKTIKNMHKNCPANRQCLDSHFRPCLRRLATDEDPDVKFFANSCLQQMAMVDQGVQRQAVAAA